jgi:hypothetical protein
MPALYRTIVPRLRKSLVAHGVVGTLRRSFVAPIRLLREYLDAKAVYSPRSRDPFDLAHDVETSQRIHQSDLRVDSSNWAHGVGYWPCPETVVRQALAALPICHEQFTFVDLGSGKGRVLLMASDYPFARIIGVEYAPELNEASMENLRRYRSESQKCRKIEAVCQDMTMFELPDTPLVVFLYNPATEAVMRIVAGNIMNAALECLREIWVIYVTPAYDVFERDLCFGPSPVHLRKAKETSQYAIYTIAT